MAGKSRSKERDFRPGAATSKWEWVAAAVGLVLVLGAVGFIVYNALTAEPSVPAVTVEHVGTERSAGGYVVKFRARNSGPSTAASLTISGTLHDGSTEIEKSEVTLDYLPPRGERQGGLIFQTDPSEHELRLTAQGYVDP
jgi:uncharacterized protein (TIGR02588 family)